MPHRLSHHHQEHHYPDMATFDNPSYFTIAGQHQLSVTVSQESGLSAAGAKPKRFKNWFKIGGGHGTKSKQPMPKKNHPNLDNNYQPPCPSPELPPPTAEVAATNPGQQEVVYYNFTSAPTTSIEPEAANDDVFSDAWTTTEPTTRTLTRRRHSFGSWFRSSLAAVRKQSTTSSTGSGLESGNHGETSSGRATDHRPSTSSERALLPRNVSSSANCVSYRSSRDVRTPEPGRPNNNNVSGGGEVKAKRSRLPIAVKSNVELRARARYGRQTEKVDINNRAVSTSRIPRPVHHQQSASLDRRYTNSTEVLTNEHHRSASESHPALQSSSTVPMDQQRMEGEDRFQANGLRGSPCTSIGSRKRISGSNTPSRSHRLIQRSRTIEDRLHQQQQRTTSCCGRMAAAAPSLSSRRRSSLDATGQSSRRRCQRCRDKAEASPDAEMVDVVIIFSRNCVVAYQWITYLTEVLNNLFRDVERPPTRVTSRDVESLVSCGSQGQPDSRFERSEYQNDEASEQLELERSARQHAVRKTVSSASLQIVLLSKSLLNHIGLHANDPLGGLLHPKRVLGVLLGVNEEKDITQLHISALYTFDDWPKVTMLDQDLQSVTEFHTLARNILCRSQPVALTEAKLQPARFKITPRKIRSGEERVTLILLETAENIQSLASVYVGLESSGKEPVRVDKLSWPNPYTITFSVPREFLEREIIVKVQLKVGGTLWGTRDLKCSSKLGELTLLLGKKQLVGNPLDIMCQALNISPMDQRALDLALSQNLDKKNINGSLFKFQSPGSNVPSEEEFPTLVHFASRFGFDQLLGELLQCPGAYQAIQVRNCNGQTALQVGQANDHQAVVSRLEAFTEEHYDRIDSQRCHQSGQVDQDEKEEYEEDYVLMNASNDGQQVVATPHDDYDVLPPAKPIPLDLDEDLEEEEEEEEEETRVPANEGDYVAILRDDELIEEDEGAIGGEVELRGQVDMLGKARDKKVRTLQDELRDVLREFKEGRIDPRQAEIFLESWKQRKDVQEDADKKREILLQMEEEAKRNLALHKKKSAKKEGIFKRLLGGSKPNLTTKNPAEEPSEAPVGVTKLMVNTLPLSPMISTRLEVNRGTSPYSSWSGSDRSSVASRVSSHDSGAHSDSPDEKKALQMMRNDYDVPLPTDSSLKMSDYLVPPPPRPVDVVEQPTVLLPPRPPNRFLVLPPLPVPPKPVRPFEVREVNPPASLSNRAEDLGRILPSEEPDVMEQAPILLPKPPRTSPDCLLQQSDYLVMSPKLSAKEEADSGGEVGKEDNYVRADELHMPENSSASSSTEQRARTYKIKPNRLSTSTSKLPTSSDEASVTEWRSDPSLNLRTPPPVAPRRVFVGVPPVPAPRLGPPSPTARPRPALLPKPDFLVNRDTKKSDRV